MKIGDRIEMPGSVSMAAYWGTVASNSSKNRFWINWDNDTGHSWIWSPSEMQYDEVIEAGGKVHES